jgi:hypothetical protein
LLNVRDRDEGAIAFKGYFQGCRKDAIKHLRRNDCVLTLYHPCLALRCLY